MVIQRETRFLVNLIFTEMFRSNITIKTFYKNPPIFYSHYINVCACILTYSLVVSKSFVIFTPSFWSFMQMFLKYTQSPQEFQAG